MDDFAHNVLLLDFYSALLTDKQRNMYHKRYCEDMTLAEIGHELKISRQAVRETVLITQRKLEELEADLQLIALHKTSRVYLDELKLALENGDISEGKRILTALDQLIMEG
ncbi:MAG: hypothetical protein FWD97_05955 [Defluviitaleaceae bacterium]|nr:hypothetical protein [Defluviitaleaceae bacterium]